VTGSSAILASALAAALAGAACSSRAVPAAWPRAAAASPEAPEAPAAPGPLALSSDPPLPGEAAPGWEGLDDDAGVAPDDAAPPPLHHGMHHGGERAR
jgi:hypothetical protein